MKRMFVVYCALTCVFSATAMEIKTVLHRKLEERNFAMRFAFLQVNFQQDPHHSNNVAFPDVRNPKKLHSLTINQVKAEILNDIKFVQSGKISTYKKNHTGKSIDTQVSKYTLLATYFSTLKLITNPFNNNSKQIKIFANNLPQKFFTTNTTPEQRYEATKKHIQYIQKIVATLKTNDAKETIKLCKSYNTLQRHPNLTQINCKKAAKEFILHKEIKSAYDKYPAVYNLCLELQEKKTISQ